jgi:hypothetical protein
MSTKTGVNARVVFVKKQTAAVAPPAARHLGVPFQAA